MRELDSAKNCTDTIYQLASLSGKWIQQKGPLSMSQNFRFRKRATAVVGVALSLSWLGFTNASALTGKEVTEKMSQDQQFGYLAGLVDMSVFQAAMSGNGARSNCIYEAFYKNVAKDSSPWRRIDAALREHPDKRAESIVHLLLLKICGT